MFINFLHNFNIHIHLEKKKKNNSFTSLLNIIFYYHPIPIPKILQSNTTIIIIGNHTIDVTINTYPIKQRTNTANPANNIPATIYININIQSIINISVNGKLNSTTSPIHMC